MQKLKVFNEVAVILHTPPDSYTTPINVNLQPRVLAVFPMEMLDKYVTHILV